MHTIKDCFESELFIALNKHLPQRVLAADNYRRGALRVDVGQGVQEGVREFVSAEGVFSEDTDFGVDGDSDLKGEDRDNREAETEEL